MLEVAGVKGGDTVYDLGSGDGRIVIEAVKKYMAKRGIGIEKAPERVRLARANAGKAGVADKVEIREGDVLELKDLSDASVVTLQLLPDVNERLRPVLRKSLKPGARVVSYDFDMGEEWKPEKEVVVKDLGGREHTIYLWTIKEGRKVEPKKDGPPTAGADDTIRVPYVPTPETVVNEMLKLAGVNAGDVVYDLGCGDGRIVIAAVKDFKAKKGVGVDIDPQRVKESKQNAKAAKVEDKVTFREGDVLKIADVSEATVVTLYLFPEVNERLAPMLRKTLKPGARIVSHDFLMGEYDWKPDKQVTVTVAGGEKHDLYLWTIPK
jgi:cyclopropane fatty-acyl-phospholipid synthase-like methyltransferase